MRNGFRILDADRHIVEPFEIWQSYLESELRERAPRLQPVTISEPMTARYQRLGAKALVPLPPRPYLEGRPMLRNVSERAEIEVAATTYNRIGRQESGIDAASQLRAMDAEGVDVALLLPTFGLNLDTEDGRLTRALSRAYNNWMRDVCREDPLRLCPAGLIARHEPERMVEDLEEIAGFGWSAVMLRPNPVAGRMLSDRAHEPFWSACERLGIAVVFHEGTHSYLPTVGADRFYSRFAQNACSHPMEQMMALLSLIEGGVLERHPALRVAFLEAGCGWLPYWLWRLDEVEYKHLGGEVAENVRMRPSEYFRRQCFVGIEPTEPYLPEVIRHIGDDNLIFGTDFPHPDHAEDAVDQVMSWRAHISESAMEKILWSNAARLFRPDT